jgi:DNA polymerase elongation subunit (family B)
MSTNRHSRMLFIDIETVPLYPLFEKLDATGRELWEKKHKTLRIENESLKQSYESRAGIYAEFGKVICISVGVIFVNDSGRQSLKIKSFAGDDEKALLETFSTMLSTNYKLPDSCRLCGHNIREFDVPYLCRRMLIQNIPIPNVLNYSGKKPWEVNEIDTLQMWRFGDFKNYTSLRLLAYVLNIPTPKDDIDGSDVARVYWQENNLDRIVTYCQKDVLTVARLYLKMIQDSGTIEDEDVVFVE